ncbi:hypothetical protein ACP3V3_05425 [Vibrio sp. PNB22_3_1]|uniref:hypothetical protein n=1 Tax=unclassified Vibrio TaxID=2614977 RepID=UPI00406AA636
MKQIIQEQNFHYLSTLAVFTLVLFPSYSFAEECPVTNAAVVSNAGDSNALGSISQSFNIPPGYETISGRIKFLSNEWPRWFGTEYNDTYLARFAAPGKMSILASGNVNSSSWGAGILGYNGATPEINYTLDVAGLAGKTASLYYEVRDVGDTIVDSALAVDSVKVIRTQQYLPAGGGSFTGNRTIAGTYGQGVKLTFKNLNVLGTTLSVKDSSPFGQTKELILLPQQSVTFTFTRFGEEPMGWSFDVSTKSDAFVVSYSMESTWVTGMPVNPCY